MSATHLSRWPAAAHLLLIASLSVGAAPLSGCSGADTHVKVEAASLGRVVVYRNGIAFYERRAHVQGDKLVLTVPNDKVDDFLKSLTVRDARTGKALPVSFPTQRASRGNVVDMAIALPPPGPHDLVLSYITEAPAWKPSYRVSVTDKDKVALQGWAIVDNTSGEDWRSVRVGVGSSSALAFRYDLRSVRRVHRETLRTQATFAKAPPRGGSVYGGSKALDDGGLMLADGDIPKPIGHPDRPADVPDVQPSPEPAPRVAEEREEMAVASAEKKRGLLDFFSGSKGTASGGSSGGGGRYAPAARASRRPPSPPRPSPAEIARRRAYQQQQRARQQAQAQQRRAEQKMQALAAQLNSQGGNYVIEGYANPGESSGDIKAVERANTLRNQLIAKGVAPGRLRVVGKGVVSGRAAGVRLVPEKEAPQAGGKGGADDGNPVGESHFESEVAMTVKQRTSAMVPILQQAATGEVVYLYDAEGARGNDRFAFKSIRFRNPTDSTLESGPLTVYGSGRFIGEGLTGSIPPKAVAVVPFALDRQIVVEQDQETGDRIARLVRVHRGVFTAEVKHVRTTRLKLTSRLPEQTRIFVRHTVGKGWTLESAPKLHERLGRAHLFEVALPAGKTQTVEIVETTPLTRTLDLRTPTGLGLVQVWLEGARDDSAVMKQMRAVLALHHEMGALRQTIASLRQRAGQYRLRMDELHLQILSLRSMNVGGSLLKHLDKKMKEISERVQGNTIETVNAQEKLMLTRIRFQDAAAELTLEAPTAEKTTRAQPPRPGVRVSQNATGSAPMATLR